MDAQRFLDNFSTIAEAPHGVERLRGLVLELAVSGQLTHQESADTGVDEQLSAIARLVQPSKLVDPIRPESTPWTIPPNWRWVRFKEVVDFAPGKTPSTKDSSYWEERELGALWAAIGDMPDAGTLFTTDRAISQKAVDTVMKRPPAPAGALLMSFKLTIGKVCRVGRPTYFNEAIIQIDTPREVTKEYLFRTLPLLSLGGSSKAAIKGNTLNKTSITNIPIPFPPLDEQERIVAKVDELMQLCDDLDVSQQARSQITSQLRVASVDALTSAETDDATHAAWATMQEAWASLLVDEAAASDFDRLVRGLAVRGRLSSPNRDDEPVEKLLQRIVDERADLVAKTEIRKPKALPAIDKTPVPIPPHWQWVRLGSICLEMRYGTSSKSQLQGDVPVLRMGNLQSGEVDWSSLKFSSNDEEIEKYRLPTTAVLFNRTNSRELVGKTGIYRGDRQAIFAGYLVHVRQSSGLDPEYLNLVLNSPMAREWCWEVKSDGIGQSNISASKLALFPFPLPPLAEQLRIVSTTDRLLEQCSELRSTLAAQAEEAENVALRLTASD